MTQSCPIVQADPTFNWQHFCIHTSGHEGQHDCLCGYTWT